MQDKNGEEIRWGIPGINVALQTALDDVYLVSFCAQLVLTAFTIFMDHENGRLSSLRPQRLLVSPAPLTEVIFSDRRL